MTPGELKFALTLEGKLNSLPDPEYRQLVVEALIIFGYLAKSKGPPYFSRGPLVVGNIIRHALHLFLEDQVRGEREFVLFMGDGGVMDMVEVCLVVCCVCVFGYCCFFVFVFCCFCLFVLLLLFFLGGGW